MTITLKNKYCGNANCDVIGEICHISNVVEINVKAQCLSLLVENTMPNMMVQVDCCTYRVSVCMWQPREDFLLTPLGVTTSGLGTTD